MRQTSPLQPVSAAPGPNDGPSGGGGASEPPRGRPRGAGARTAALGGWSCCRQRALRTERRYAATTTGRCCCRCCLGIPQENRVPRSRRRCHHLRRRVGESVRCRRRLARIARVRRGAAEACGRPELPVQAVYRGACWHRATHLVNIYLLLTWHTVRGAPPWSVSEAHLTRPRARRRAQIGVDEARAACPRPAARTPRVVAAAPLRTLWPHGGGARPPGTQTPALRRSSRW